MSGSPEELLRNAAAQENVTIDEREGDGSSRLLEEPGNKTSVADKLDASKSVELEEVLKNATGDL